MKEQLTATHRLQDESKREGNDVLHDVSFFGKTYVWLRDKKTRQLSIARTERIS